MKRSLIWSAKHVALGLLLVGILVSAAEAKSRKFYLTQDPVLGSQALTACATGYHMASLWEILNVSNLTYATELGFVRSDSGSGPPAHVIGWIRTGNISSTSGTAGEGNCLGWTSFNMADNGTVVLLESVWTNGSKAISPWVAQTRTCDDDVRLVRLRQIDWDAGELKDPLTDKEGNRQGAARGLITLSARRCRPVTHRPPVPSHSASHPAAAAETAAWSDTIALSPLPPSANSPQTGARPTLAYSRPRPDAVALSL